MEANDLKTVANAFARAETDWTSVHWSHLVEGRAKTPGGLEAVARIEAKIIDADWEAHTLKGYARGLATDGHVTDIDTWADAYLDACMSARSFVRGVEMSAALARREGELSRDAFYMGNYGESVSHACNAVNHEIPYGDLSVWDDFRSVLEENIEEVKSRA